jgi:hypothetical protein
MNEPCARQIHSNNVVRSFEYQSQQTCEKSEIGEIKVGRKHHFHYKTFIRSFRPFKAATV